jgi:hypothetical protein
MAFIENLFDYVEINVSQSVGLDGVNAPDDVAVVQAMLNYVCNGRPFFANYFFTEPSGRTDKETLAVIKRFQQFMRYRLKEKVSIDGRISPAEGIVAFGKAGRFTIRSLNSEAMLLHFLSESPTANYVQDIIMQYPIVQQYLGSVPVGSLNLPLEASALAVGTMNLSLE